MDETKLASHFSAWGLTRRSFEDHENVVMGIPNFSTIERFLLVVEKLTIILCMTQ